MHLHELIPTAIHVMIIYIPAHFSIIKNFATQCLVFKEIKLHKLSTRNRRLYCTLPYRYYTVGCGAPSVINHVQTSYICCVLNENRIVLSSLKVCALFFTAVINCPQLHSRKKSKLYVLCQFCDLHTCRSWSVICTDLLQLSKHTVGTIHSMHSLTSYNLLYALLY